MDRSRIRFWKLVEPEHLKVRAFCRKLMRDRDDGDDLYQESLVCALASFKNLKEENSFRPWLYRIVINRFKNLRRGAWWKRFVPLTPEISEKAGGKNPITAHTAKRRLEIAFAALSPDEHALVTLYELEGWSIAELAGFSGRSEGSLRVKLTRARRKMRGALSRFFKEPTHQEIMKNFGTGDAICVVTKPGKE